MTRLLTVLLAGGLAMTGCQTLPAETTPAPAPMPAPPPPDASSVPAGTHFNVRLDQELNTTDTRVGDSFTVTVLEPLIARNNQTVVPAGATITGMVTGVAPVRVDDPAALRLNFVRLTVDGVSHPLTAEIVGTQVAMEEHRDHAAHARAAVTGAAAGAVLGAVVGGRLRDALIGAALGAGAGTVISLGMGTDVEAVLPEGTTMTLRTVDTIRLR